MMMTEIRLISENEIEKDLFRYHIRHQRVIKCRRKVDGVWNVVDVKPFTENWGEKEYEFLAACLKNTVATGGAVYGAFVDGCLKGWASVEGKLFGSARQYLELSSMHVSEDCRRTGIGRALVERAKVWAKEHGAEKLYISAHSAVESQAFYLAMGCVEAEEYSARHVELEPADCQMELALQEESMSIKLIRPTEAYAQQVMAFKAALHAAGEGFDGCAGLQDVDSFEHWADFENRLKKKYGDGYVPSEVFLAIREQDDKVVGIIDFRHPLSDFLLRYGGNIGYSVHPEERRKGYGAEMLALLLPICKQYGEEKVLVCCDKINEASRCTILKNGGVLENEVADDAGLGQSGIVQRWWISV